MSVSVAVAKPYPKVFGAMRDWLSSWAVLGEEKVSRVDLCTDLMMALPKIDTENEMVSRARVRGKWSKLPLAEISEWKSGRHDTGYQVGKGELVARTDDKVEKIRLRHGEKGWFETLWKKNGWDGKSPITRVEVPVPL